MKIWVVVGEPYNERVISVTLFKHKEDADTYMELTSLEEPYISLNVQELVIHESFNGINKEREE